MPKHQGEKKELAVQIVKGQLADQARLLGRIHDLDSLEIATILKEISSLFD